MRKPRSKQQRGLKTCFGTASASATVSPADRQRRLAGRCAGRSTAPACAHTDARATRAYDERGALRDCVLSTCHDESVCSHPT